MPIPKKLRGCGARLLEASGSDLCTYPSRMRNRFSMLVFTCMFFIVWKKVRCPGRLDGLLALKAGLQVEGNILDVQEVGLLETEEVGRPEREEVDHPGKEEVVRLGTEEPLALLGGAVLGGPLPWGENALLGVLEETAAFLKVAHEVEAEIG